MGKKKILIIAAHPDDEILGCGATAAKMISEGSQGRTIILGEGQRSRGTGEENLAVLRESASAANKKIGISEVRLHAFPDNAFDSVRLLDIVKLVEKEVCEFEPDILFTHYGDDLNIDHRITFQAVLTACRPQSESFLPDIYSFFIPSSTDWTDGYCFRSFTPNVFVDVRNHLDTKLEALSCYTTEMRNYPHSRSIDAVRIFSSYWGNRVGLSCAEPFVLVRSFL